MVPSDNAPSRGGSDAFENFADFQLLLDGSVVRNEDLEGDAEAENVEGETPGFVDDDVESDNCDEIDEGDEVDCCELLKERCNCCW